MCRVSHFICRDWCFVFPVQVQEKEEEERMGAMLLKMRADKQTAAKERKQEDGMQKMLQQVRLSNPRILW